jgi:hypothetical protein
MDTYISGTLKTLGMSAEDTEVLKTSMGALKMSDSFDVLANLAEGDITEAVNVFPSNAEKRKAARFMHALISNVSKSHNVVNKDSSVIGVQHLLMKVSEVHHVTLSSNLHFPHEFVSHLSKDATDYKELKTEKCTLISDWIKIIIPYLSALFAVLEVQGCEVDPFLGFEYISRVVALCSTTHGIGPAMVYDREYRKSLTSIVEYLEVLNNVLQRTVYSSSFIFF